jgi:hypothetical protein
MFYFKFNAIQRSVCGALRRSTAYLISSVVVVTALGLPIAASAQCPFNVSGISSTATVAADALLLSRIARGAADAALTTGTGATRTSDAMRVAVDNTALRLDVNDSGVFDTADAAIITRYVLGFRGDALIAGGAGAHAKRATGAAIQSFIENGCKVKKRLLELGWDTPSPAHIKANITAMEQRPFSGTAVRLSVGQNIFKKVAYPDSAFTQDRSDLSTTTFTKLTDNFVSIFSTAENGWSWFSDSDWAASQTNAVNFAKTAKAGKLKGFFFDAEPYGNNAWLYSAERYPTQSFATVQAKVRQRGAAFMSAVQTEMPNIKIMLLFGVTIVKAQTERNGGVLQNAEWTLWASFVDGMLDVIGPQVQLIDGDEESYYYTAAQNFDDFRLRKRSTRDYVSSENRVNYDNQVRVAHAVYIDGTLNLWKSSLFLGHFFANDTDRKLWLEFTIYHGLRASDEYLWVYSENMDWWNAKGGGFVLPDGVEAAVARALQNIDSNQPLTITVSQSMLDAFAANDDKRYIGGQIKDANGNGIPGATLTASGLPGAGTGGLGDVYCRRPDVSNGVFACFFPRYASYTITPSKAGYTFNPPSRTYSRTTNPSSDWGHAGQDFVGSQ